MVLLLVFMQLTRDLFAIAKFLLFIVLNNTHLSTDMKSLQCTCDDKVCTSTYKC